MKELLLSRAAYALNLLNTIRKEHRLMFILMVLWATVTNFFSSPEFSTGINQSVPIMIVLALITFLILLYLCYWLLERYWQRVGLPGIEIMVLQFKKMRVWQQLGFYWLSLLLLVLTALGCLGVVL